MHVLLPPSEAKTTGGRGAPVRLRRDTAGERVDDPLAHARSVATAALLELVGGQRSTSLRALLLPDGVADAALSANATVLDTRTTPALRRYSGVVYEGLAVESLSPVEQRLAGRSTLVFSGLWGVVRGDEAIPEYRVPAKAELPGLGIASTYWRPVLTSIMPRLVRRGLILDLRSGDYAAMWRPDRETARRVVAARVLSPAPRGGHAVISHTSKLAKGRLAAALVRRASRGEQVDTPEDIAAAWIECGGVGSERAPDAAGAAAHLILYTG